MCDTIIQGRREGLTKREILKRLCHIEGVYVPAFYDVSYRPDGRVWKPSRRKKARWPWCARPSFRI